MRFTRHQRHEYEDTRLKRLAALRWQKKQRDSLPLFAAEIGAQQPDIDSVMARRVAAWRASQDSNRLHLADEWRRGRRHLATYDDETRQAALTYWNNHKWLPATPSYFNDMLHMLDTGRLVQEGGTLRAARTTITRAEAIAPELSPTPPMLPGLVRVKPAPRGPRP